MKFQGNIINNKINFHDQGKFEDFLSKNDGKVFTITFEDNQRTARQNNSLHLYFEMLSDALNEAGLDMKGMMKADIPWNAYNVKNELWRPLQEMQLGKKSTTKLSTKDIDKIYDTLNRYLGEKYKVHVPFPSIESMY